jgi:Vitamin B6 photo-protection and homoeostasis
VGGRILSTRRAREPSQARFDPVEVGPFGFSTTIANAPSASKGARWNQGSQERTWYSSTWGSGWKRGIVPGQALVVHFPYSFHRIAPTFVETRAEKIRSRSFFMWKFPQFCRTAMMNETRSLLLRSRIRRPLHDRLRLLYPGSNASRSFAGPLLRLKRPASSASTDVREIVEVSASVAAVGRPRVASEDNSEVSGADASQHVPASATVYTIDSNSSGWTRREVNNRRRPWNVGVALPSSDWLSSSKIVSHFLPSNYPHSVAPGYFHFCRGNFVASVAGSAAMVLSTQTLLLAVGVVGSTAAASGGAATSGVLAGALNWVLKDGVGQLGGVLYASRQSRAFDAHPKQMRMVAAMALDAASFVEILSPSLPSTMVLPAACAANVLKNIGYLAASASRAALHQSLAKGSLGDVVAKAGSQSMAAGLIGTALGIGVSMSVLHNPHDFVWAWCVLSGIHQAGNYWSLQSIVINHFNRPRLDVVLGEYLETGHVLSPEQVSQKERIYDSLLPKFLDRTSNGSWLVVGSRVDQACPLAADLSRYLDASRGESYLLTVVANDAASHPVVHLILFQSATGEDSVRGILHAHLLRKHIANDDDANAGFRRLDLPYVVQQIGLCRQQLDERIPTLLASMHEVGWKTDTELTVVEPNHAHRIVMQRPTSTTESSV